MEHDNVADGSCDRRLLAEPPGTPTHSSPSFSLRRRAREPVFNSDPARFPNAGIPDRSGKASQPTQPQERALLSLARFSPWKVAAWVEILRSLAPGYQHVGRLAPLTPLELNAVHELKDCEEDWLLAWLNIAAQYRQCAFLFIKMRKRLTGICRGKTTIIARTELSLGINCKPSRFLTYFPAGVLDACSCLCLVSSPFLCIQPQNCSEHPP